MKYIIAAGIILLALVGAIGVLDTFRPPELTKPEPSPLVYDVFTSTGKFLFRGTLVGTCGSGYLFREVADGAFRIRNAEASVCVPEEMVILVRALPKNTVERGGNTKSEVRK